MMTDKREFTIKRLKWVFVHPDRYEAQTELGDYAIIKKPTFWQIRINGDAVPETFAEAEAFTHCVRDYEERLSQCFGPVVKVECGICAHFGKTWSKYSAIPMCEKYNVDIMDARRNDCDNGRGGELKN